MNSPQPAPPTPQADQPKHAEEAKSPAHVPKAEVPSESTSPRKADEEGKSGRADEKGGHPEKPDVGRDHENAQAPDADESGIPESVFETLLNARGYRTERVNSSGPFAYGEGATANQYIGVARPEFRLEPRTEESVRDELEAHVPGPSDDLLAERLRDQHLVCLLGEPCSGRTQVALAALAEHHGTAKIADLIGPSDAPLTAATREADLLGDGCGHLLRLDAEQLNRRELTDLESTAKRHGASVVVISSQTVEHSDLTRFVVDHVPPDSVEVFQAHLRRLLGKEGGCAPRCDDRRADCPASCIDRYVTWCLDDQGFRAELSAVHRPQEAMRLASKVAAKRVTDGAGLKWALEDLSTHLVQSARSLLAGSSEPDAVKRRWMRAYRIAYLVLSDCPRAAVVEAASDLFKRLKPTEATAQTTPPAGAGMNTPPSTADDGGGQIPDITFDVLIPLSMRDRVDDDADRAAKSPTTNRIMPAMLDVAWNDYPSAPRVLVAWLNKLVLHRHAKVRFRASVVAGFFAGFDRDLIFNELISLWAKHDRPGARQAAALACVFAAEDQRLTQAVTERIRDWIRKGPLLARDTVARAYAAGLSERVSMRTSVRHLRRIASDDRYWYSPMVALAMERLFTEETAEALIREVRSWLYDGRLALAVHAGRTVAELAERTTQSSLIAWPTMLRWSGNDLERLDHIADLWCHALLLPPSAFGAWRAFESWVHASGFDPRLEEIVLAVVERICAVQSLRVRMRFHLDRVWALRKPAYPTTAKIAELLEEVDE